MEKEKESVLRLMDKAKEVYGEDCRILFFFEKGVAQGEVYSASHRDAKNLILFDITEELTFGDLSKKMYEMLFSQGK
jgi:hypothetical protein